MTPSMPEWIQACASVLTLGAAIVAAIIAAKAPRMAAKYAEEYRRETARQDEQAKFQTDIFRALMKGRNEIANADSRAAINLVESAFPHSTAVRNARRMFTKAAGARPFDADQFVKCYFDLIEAVASAIGLSEVIDRFDIESGYYPEALSKLDAAALIEAEKRLAEASHATPAQPGATNLS